MVRVLQRLLRRAWQVLRTGGALPEELWRRRPRDCIVLLWLHVVAFLFLGLGTTPWFITVHSAPSNPIRVYNHGAARENPRVWAGVHGGFVLAAAVASLITRKLNEDAARAG